MRSVAFYLLLSFFILANFACTEVGKNNQAANGQSVTAEDSSELDDLDETEASEEPTSDMDTPEKSSPTKAPNTPEALVENLYMEEEKENTPFFQDKDRPLVDKFFAKGLADLIWKDAVDAKDDDVGALDFDPLYNSQDAEVSELKVGDSEPKGEKATVVVTFLNFGEPQTVKYLLTKEKGQWKIEDIDYGKESLVKIFKQGKRTETETDET